MNPISSLYTAALPQFQRVAQPATDMDAAARISATELQGLSPTGATGGPVETSGSFGNVLGQFLNDVNAKQAAAGDAVNGVLSGQNVPLHQAMVAMEEASVSFQMMVEVRNKLLDSYQELMRMQV
ncbi:MAG TPA: flagellar hook-basal body complex protein FliE [Verrucomicrobiae bacterium]|nr:flagellar hook-basal body complex protein FliE [Verrucomicrobiae bacterium]